MSFQVPRKFYVCNGRSDWMWSPGPDSLRPNNASRAPDLIETAAKVRSCTSVKHPETLPLPHLLTLLQRAPVRLAFRCPASVLHAQKVPKNSAPLLS